jgi:hypothetical protein
MFWKTKPEDKLWRNLNKEINDKVGLTFLILMVLILIYVSIDLNYKSKEMESFAIVLIVVLASFRFQETYRARAMCRVMQKQQEQLDKLLEITEIAKPGTEISPEVREKLIDKLYALLLNEDVETRRFSAELLGNIGDKRAIPPLINMLSDPDKTVVETVKRIIEKLR